MASITVDSTLWDGAIKKLATVNNIDFTSGVATTLYTVPAGKTFVPCFFVYRATTVTAFLVGGTIQFGTNDPDYNNIIGATSPSGMENIGNFLPFPTPMVGGVSTPFVAAGGVVKVDVAVGVTATACVGSIDVFGYLF